MLELIQLLYLMKKNDKRLSLTEYEKLRKYCADMMANAVTERRKRMIDFLFPYRNRNLARYEDYGSIEVLKGFIRKFSMPYQKAVKLKKLK